MRTIDFYKYNGEVVSERPLDELTILDCHGMKVRCTLIDGSYIEGFANPFYSFETGDVILDTSKLDYMTLETYVNLDEETNSFVGSIDDKYDVKREAVSISLIARIDAILYSGLRWGGVPTNKFNLKLDTKW